MHGLTVNRHNFDGIPFKRFTIIICIMTGKGLEKWTVYIDKEIAEKFKILVIRKHGKMKGALSQEVNDALANWIGAHTNVANVQSNINPNFKVHKIFQQVKDYLLEHYMIKNNRQISDNLLRRAIAIVRGPDERTIRKWLKEFKKAGLIKPIAPGIWEIN